MSDIIRFSNDAPPVSGLNPESQGAANFLVAAGYTVLALAAYINEMLAKRLKVHFTCWTDQANATDPEAPQLRVLLHTSPDVWGASFVNTSLRCRLVLSASRFDSGTQPDPLLGVVIRNISAGNTAGATAATLHNTHRDSTVGPDNLWFADIEIPLEAGVTPDFGRDRTCELQISTFDLCQIVSCTVHEVPRLSLNPVTDVDVAAPTNDFFVGGHIYDGPLADLYEALRRLYDRQGSVYFAWSAMYSSLWVTAAAASFTNLWDANTSWDAGAFGFYAWPENQGTLDSDDIGVVVWAILEVGADGSSDQIMGALEWITQAETIGRLDVQHYVPPVGVDPATCALALQTTWPDGGSLASALVEVLGRYDGAGAGMVVKACGMYAKEPLDPRTIPDLAVWLRADDLDLADTDPVPEWLDRSGNGNDAAQATAGKRPTFVEDAISGRGAVRFDGVDDNLAIADDASFKGSAITAYVVMRVTATSDPQAVIGYPHNVTHTSPFWRWGLVLRTNPTWDLYNAGTVFSPSIDFATKKLMRLWRYQANGSSSQILSQDSGTDHSGSGGAITYPNAVGLRIGADAGGGSPLGADICEILVFTRVLSFLERVSVEEMLSERYGLLRGAPTV